MSVSMARSNGVTMITLTSDPSSACPPLCQLLGALCYTPALCSSSRRVGEDTLGAQVALGALWMVSGVVQLGLGLALLLSWMASYELRDTWGPVWLGPVFAGIGVSCILTQKFPKPFVLLISIILNLFGVCMSVTALVWYAPQFTSYFRFHDMCRGSYDSYNYWIPRTTPTLSPQEQALQQTCEVTRTLLFQLNDGISALLTVLSVLGVCVGLSSVILNCKALRCKGAPLLEGDGAAAVEVLKGAEM